MTDDCAEFEGCVFDEACPFHLSCTTAAFTDHEEGNCADWEPYCPACREESLR